MLPDFISLFHHLFRFSGPRSGKFSTNSSLRMLTLYKLVVALMNVTKKNKIKPI
jgi:hypothetical protein